MFVQKDSDARRQVTTIQAMRMELRTKSTADCYYINMIMNKWLCKTIVLKVIKPHIME